MHSIISRRLIAVGITAAAVAVSGAPAAQASKKSEKKQNSAIKKVAKAGKKINSKANAARDAADSAANAAADAKNAATTADKKGADAGTVAAAAQAGVNAILSQVPTITGALQKLADGLTQAATGLTALQTALGQVATSQEYGVVSVLVGPPVGGGFAPLGLTSSDIPDDGNSAPASGVLPIAVDAPQKAGLPVTLRAGIRTGETDGKATGDPAGYVGGLLTETCATPTCTIPTGQPAPNDTTTVPAGTLLCSVGPSAATQIPIPGGEPAPFFVQKIQVGLSRVPGSTGSNVTPATSDSSVNPLQGASGTGVSGPLSDGTNFGCKLPLATGNVATFNAQTQFVDVPTSLTPGITD